MDAQKDLCKQCAHLWFDFIVNPDKKYIPHCEIIDGKYGLSKDMDDVVSYPCLECPFNSFVEKYIKAQTK